MEKEKKSYKKAWLNALLALIPGAGQVRNRQWYKAIFLWVVLALVILVEFSTGTRGDFDKEKDIYIPENKIEVRINYNSNEQNTVVPVKGTQEWKNDKWVDSTDILNELDKLSSKSKAEAYFEVDKLVNKVMEEEGFATEEEAREYVFATNVNNPDAVEEDPDYYIQQSSTKKTTTCYSADGERTDCDGFGGVGNTEVTTGVWVQLRLYSYEMNKNDSEARKDYEIEYYNTVQEKIDNLNAMINDYNAKVAVVNNELEVLNVELEKQISKFNDELRILVNDKNKKFEEKNALLKPLIQQENVLINEYNEVIKNSQLGFAEKNERISELVQSENLLIDQQNEILTALHDIYNDEIIGVNEKINIANLTFKNSTTKEFINKQTFNELTDANLIKPISLENRILKDTDDDKAISGKVLKTIGEESRNVTIKLTSNQLVDKDNDVVINALQPTIKATVKYTSAQFYYYRDYGGFFTNGVWGLFSLGKIKNGDEYRGTPANVELKQYWSAQTGTQIVEPVWTRYDVSQYLMALGLVAMVVLAFTLVLYAWTIIDAYKVQKSYIDGQKPLRFKEWFKKVFDSMFAYIILIPAIILVVCFTFIPMLFSLFVAFTNYSYASGTITAGTIFKWDGFNAFLTIVKDKDVLGFFLDVLLWTVIWAFCTSFTVYAMGFVNALIVESKAVSGIKIYLKNGKCLSFFGKKFWRTIMILPWAIPGMITLMSAKNMFAIDGPVNTLLGNAGLSQTVADFLQTIGLTEGNNSVIEWLGAGTGENANLAKVVLIVVNLWLGSPYHMMLIIGVLATISPELYEAADIDGASGFQKFRYITLPQVLISTLPSIIMTFSHNFNNFGAIYFLTGGGPLRADYIGKPGVPGKTDILISWIYKLTFTENEQYYNRGAIYSIMIFLGIGIVSVWNMSRTKMMQEEE